LLTYISTIRQYLFFIDLKWGKRRLFFVYYIVGLVLKKTVKAMEADWILTRSPLGRAEGIIPEYGCFTAHPGVWIGNKFLQSFRRIL
jgi:hypothetical protein